YYFNPSVTYPWAEEIRFIFGAMIKNVDEKEQAGTFVADTKPYGINNLSLLGSELGLEVDGRDHEKAPYKGYYFNLTGTYYTKAFNNHYHFSRLSYDMRAYAGYKQNISLALRVQGEKLFGTFPFFESAFLGGISSLRGFSSERFAGDASVAGTAELRLKLFKMNLLLPETIGVFGFGETGRVCLKGENSNTWHASYGGGLFMHVISREITLKLTYARSVEKDYAIYFTTGFGF